MNRRNALSLVLAPLALALLPTGLAAQSVTPPTKLVVFGASMADPGNVYALSHGYLPAPPYWNGRFSNGPNWVDQLAPMFNLPVATPFVTGGLSFAVGGAGTGSGYSKTACLGTTCAPNMGKQIEIYLARNPVITGNELFILQGGGNDFLQFTGLDNAALTAFEMRCNIETLAKAGAKRFAVVNLGQDNTSPVEWRTSNNAWIDNFNKLQEANLTDLETKLNLKIARVDWHMLKSSMIAYPAVYGLTDVTGAAWIQGNPVPSDPYHYLYWDGAHPTTTVQTYLAKLAASSVKQKLGL